MSATEAPSRPYTLTEAAERLRVSVGTLRRMVKACEIDFIQRKPGAPITLTETGCAAWIERNTRAARAEPNRKRRAR